MKTTLRLLFITLSSLSHALTPAELADSYHARGLAAEKRGDLLTAENCYELALRMQPGHAGAATEKSKMQEKWTSQPAARMASTVLNRVQFTNATLSEALEYVTHHTGLLIEDGDAYDAPLQNLVSEIQAWHRVPQDQQKAAWAELVKRTRHGRALQKLADAVIGSQQARISIDMAQTTADELLKKIAVLTGLTMHHQKGKILYSVRKTPIVDSRAKRSAAVSDATRTRLTALADDFQNAGAAKVEADHQKMMQDLKTKYLAAVKRSQADARKAGQTAAADALQEEESKISVGVDLPVSDDPQTADAVKKLRDIYRTEAAKAAQVRAASLKPLLDRYDAELTALEASVADKPDDLAAVKAAREQINKQP